MNIVKLIFGTDFLRQSSASSFAANDCVSGLSPIDVHIPLLSPSGTYAPFFSPHFFLGGGGGGGGLDY